MTTSYRFQSAVRGNHVYMNDWSPTIGDEFQVEIEELNLHNKYAVAM